MKWNQYISWSGGVNNNIVYRMDNEEIPDWEEGEIIDGNDEKPEYQIERKETKGLEIIYRVVANEGDNNIYGLKEQSISNEVSITGDQIAYFPSAFAPLSEIESNTIFKPVGKLIDYDNWLII